LAHGADARDRSRVVQRREILDRVEVVEHVVADTYRLGQSRTAVDDAVPDRLEVVDLPEEAADRFKVVHSIPALAVVAAT